MKVVKEHPLLGRTSVRSVSTIVFALGLLASDPALLAQGGRTSEHWVGTWATVPVARCPGQPAGVGPQGQASGLCGSRVQTTEPPRTAPPAQALLPVLSNQTLRQIVHTSLGGDRIRIVLTNVYGTVPVTVGAAHVALREKDAAIASKSGRALTFGGNAAATIPPGAVIFSDPVMLTVPPLADLAIDIYLPGDAGATTSPLTVHAGTGSLQTNYISPAGNHAGSANMPVQATTLAWLFLARVEVMAPEAAGAIVTLGDSITDGSRSTPDTNSRWPDHLARRLAAQNIKMGVLNAGFSGNRLLSDGNSVGALARFDRDVLAQTGATHVIVLEGINDLGFAGQNPRPGAADLIAAHRQLIARAHAHGLKIYGATLTPFGGTTIANYWTAEGEAARQALNEWIRTSHAYDGVIDFEAVVRDPSDQGKYLARYDSGDHLHPGDAGYQAIANAIDLELFKRD